MEERFEMFTMLITKASRYIHRIKTQEMAEFNFRHSGTETVYLDAAPEFDCLSSTCVREKIAKKEDLSGLLSEKVVKLLQNKM